MDAYDRLMLEYYRTLNNAWTTEIKDASRKAIQMLSDMPKAEKMSKAQVEKVMQVIASQLGDDFAAAVNQPTKTFMERCIRTGLGDSKAMTRTSIGLWGAGEQSLATSMQRQQVFWVGNHFDADVRQKFTEVLTRAIDQGYTKDMLADTLKEQFRDLGTKSAAYWQGLAEHTGLRMREFGRLRGYQKAKVQYYRLVVILDDRTSDICRALAVEGKQYPLNDAVQVMDQLQALDPKGSELDDARDYVKALAPWVKDDQIVRDDEDKPIGISGAHTPFPPFHFRCRTTTEIV
jgi:hypothetical protein